MRHLPEVEELGKATLLGTKSFSLKSRPVDQTFIIDVCRPAYPAAADRALPVVYVLDGSGAFGIAAQTARMLQSGPGSLPPMIVVGIGYKVDRARNALAQHHEMRVRDFTPTADTAWLERSRAALAEQNVVSDAKPGGVAAFLAFIDDELKPFVASHYAVNADDQTLVGMSLGGLFALYTLFQAPRSFVRYLALSPSLWWDERMLFKREAALAATVKDLPVRLFLSAGALEEDDGAPYFPVSTLEDMAEALRKRRYPGLQITHHIFPGETHMSVYPAAISRGLREVFR